jgi:hypothetical protein
LQLAATCVRAFLLHWFQNFGLEYACMPS